MSVLNTESFQCYIPHGSLLFLRWRKKKIQIYCFILAVKMQVFSYLKWGTRTFFYCILKFFYNYFFKTKNMMLNGILLIALLPNYEN